MDIGAPIGGADNRAPFVSILDDAGVDAKVFNYLLNPSELTYFYSYCCPRAPEPILLAPRTPPAMLCGAAKHITIPRPDFSDLSSLSKRQNTYARPFVPLSQDTMPSSRHFRRTEPGGVVSARRCAPSLRRPSKHSMHLLHVPTPVIIPQNWAFSLRHMLAAQTKPTTFMLLLTA